MAIELPREPGRLQTSLMATILIRGTTHVRVPHERVSVSSARELTMQIWEFCDFRKERLTDSRFIGLLCKAVSTSATFVFTMDAIVDRFLSATDPVSRNRCSKRVIVDTFSTVSPGYFC
ncbi:hypothetical protein TNCV_4276281 [Trichonephila clavipes]|nr:hypothetical protein TNCV_4276281 [Trichonephila clavipes]